MPQNFLLISGAINPKLNGQFTAINQMIDNKKAYQNTQGIYLFHHV